ncbi:hypothetical protein Tco_0622701 [Tanacetum coccineum]
MPTYRTAVVDAVHNDEELRLNLDLLKERHERVVIREAKAKLKMTKYYNAKVQGVTFRPGDFVYHSNDASHIVDGGYLPKVEGQMITKHSEIDVQEKGLWTKRSFRGRGTSPISRNVISKQ